MEWPWIVGVAISAFTSLIVGWCIGRQTRFPDDENRKVPYWLVPAWGAIWVVWGGVCYDDIRAALIVGIWLVVSTAIIFVGYLGARYAPY